VDNLGSAVVTAIKEALEALRESRALSRLQSSVSVRSGELKYISDLVRRDRRWKAEFLRVCKVRDWQPRFVDRQAEATGTGSATDAITLEDAVQSQLENRREVNLLLLGDEKHARGVEIHSFPFVLRLLSLSWAKKARWALASPIRRKAVFPVHCSLDSPTALLSDDIDACLAQAVRDAVTACAETHGDRSPLVANFQQYVNSGDLFLLLDLTRLGPKLQYDVLLALERVFPRCWRVCFMQQPIDLKREFASIEKLSSTGMKTLVPVAEEDVRRFVLSYLGKEAGNELLHFASKEYVRRLYHPVVLAEELQALKETSLSTASFLDIHDNMHFQWDADFSARLSAIHSSTGLEERRLTERSLAAIAVLLRRTQDRRVSRLEMESAGLDTGTIDCALGSQLMSEAGDLIGFVKDEDAFVSATSGIEEKLDISEEVAHPSTWWEVIVHAAERDSASVVGKLLSCEDIRGPLLAMACAIRLEGGYEYEVSRELLRELSRSRIDALLLDDALPRLRRIMGENKAHHVGQYVERVAGTGMSETESRNLRDFVSLLCVHGFQEGIVHVLHNENLAHQARLLLAISISGARRRGAPRVSHSEPNPYVWVAQDGLAIGVIDRLIRAMSHNVWTREKGIWPWLLSAADIIKSYARENGMEAAVCVDMVREVLLNRHVDRETRIHSAQVVHSLGDPGNPQTRPRLIAPIVEAYRAAKDKVLRRCLANLIGDFGTLQDAEAAFGSTRRRLDRFESSACHRIRERECA